jgi:hypothetical protein
MGTEPLGIVTRTTAATFRNLSRLRGRRIFHPDGVGFTATLVPAPARTTGAALFDSIPDRGVIVRLSRSVGLPESFRDPCGLAIRVPDAYGPGRDQDFLLVSSGLAVGTRHLLLPSRGFASSSYSSLLPYRIAGRTFLIGAVPNSQADGPTLADLRQREHAGLSFRLTGAPLFGDWESVASLELGERLDDAEVEDLRFDPSNTGGGLELAGLLNHLRAPAYRASQDGRGAPESRPRRVGEPENPPAARAA